MEFAPDLSTDILHKLGFGLGFSINPRLTRVNYLAGGGFLDGGRGEIYEPAESLLYSLGRFSDNLDFPG